MNNIPEQQNIPPMPECQPPKDDRITKALDIAFQYAQIDGGHHKAWVIDQMVRALTGDEYEQWVKEYCYDEETHEEYWWDTGIAP